MSITTRKTKMSHLLIENLFVFHSASLRGGTILLSQYSVPITNKCFMALMMKMYNFACQNIRASGLT